MDASPDIAEVMTAQPEVEGVGAYLRGRRLALGLSHADVASTVKLSPRRIAALEDERWTELPDGPFLRGFLRNVARALDLDANALMARVDASVMRERNPESILVSPVTTQATIPRRRGPNDDRHGGRALIFGAFAFAIVAALISWSGTDSFDRSLTTGKSLFSSSSTPVAATTPTVVPDATPASLAAAKSADVVGAAVPPVAADAGPADTRAAASPLALLFHFNEESWVEVRAADGRVLLKSLNAAGSDQQVEGEAPFSLIVGNAKGVALRFRGQPVDLGPYTHDSVARFTLS